MFRPGELFRRFLYLINRRRYDDLLRHEMDAHRLMLPVPSRFGNAGRLFEDTRDAWGWGWLDALKGDVRLASRVLSRSPGFTVVAIASLAGAFALVAGTFAIVNAYLRRPLPYAAASRLYHVRYAPPGPWEPAGMSGLDWSTVNDVIEFPITAAGDTFYLTDGSYAQPARGLRVNHDFVQGLGVQPAIGRILDERDWHPGAEPVTMLGYAIWRDRYAGSPAILGTLIRAGTESQRGPAETRRVVGVLAPDFYFGRDSLAKVDLLMPLSERTRTYMVRLRPDVPVSVAEQRLTLAARAVATDLPSDWTGVHLESVHERYVGELRPILMGATAGTGLIVLLVCANLGVLTLLRVVRREKEMAIRVALGSGRWRLTRMLAIEGGLLAGAGVLSGLALGYLTLRLLGPTIQARLGRPAPGGASTIAIDGTVVLVVAGVALVVALSLAFLPVLAPWQRRMGSILGRDRGVLGDGPSLRRLRSGLLAGQVAATIVLLIGGGLLVRSTRSMVRTDLGFEPDQLVRARVELRSADYPDGPAYDRFYERFTTSVASRAHAPVVFSSWPPFAALPLQSVEGDEATAAGVRAGLVKVGGGYFATVGIRLRQGRDISIDEERAGAAVAIVSETLAGQLWPAAGSVIGRRVRAIERTPAGSTTGAWHTVIGIAADVRQDYFDGDVADLYVPLSPDIRGRFGSFYVRSNLAPGALWPTLRAAAAEIDPNAIVGEPRRVAAENQQFESARFLSRALGAIAVTALLLVVLGIYGVTAFTVSQRAREMAVRMALGATVATVRTAFLREIGVVLIAGLSVGLLVALGLSRVVESYLYGVPARDPATLASATLLLIAVALLSGWGPIRRATLQSPARVLREG